MADGCQSHKYQRLCLWALSSTSALRSKLYKQARVQTEDATQTTARQRTVSKRPFLMLPTWSEMEGRTPTPIRRMPNLQQPYWHERNPNPASPPCSFFALAYAEVSLRWAEAIETSVAEHCTNCNHHKCSYKGCICRSRTERTLNFFLFFTRSPISMKCEESRKETSEFSRMDE